VDGFGVVGAALQVVIVVYWVGGHVSG
jgi:hypothetical protein